MMKNIFTSSQAESDLNCFSETLKGRNIKLYDRNQIANGERGYASVLGTKGAAEGTFYYEALVLNPSADTLYMSMNPIGSSAAMLLPLQETGDMLHLSSLSTNPPAAHTRIGFSTVCTDTETPTGSDKFSYSYRDWDGSVFHEGEGREYGKSYYVNDTISCIIHLPPQKPKLKGQAAEEFIRSPGSWIRFFVNGEDQGLAFRDIFEGVYFPSVALYQYARVELKLQGEFAYPEILESFNAEVFSYSCSAHLFSSRTCCSSSGVKSFSMLNVRLISSGFFPFI